MKKNISLLFLLLLMLVGGLQAQTPSFPGADGYGRYTKGGRGGSVYYVTTLEDGNAPGTLRYAVEHLSNVTILFKVSGTIHLDKQLRISNHNITIAGQTAPGDGICIADYPVLVSADNIVVRYLRFRMGDEKVTVEEAEGADAFGGRFCHNVIIDHCSVSWCTDECASFYANYDFTMQWCIISESLRMSKHPKQAHGYGAIWGGMGASYYHNMIIHHDSRTPRFGTGNVMPLEDHKTDMRNNVIYNWSGNGCYGAEGMYINIVNNYWKPGPATTGGSKNRFIGIDDATPGDGNTSVWGKFHITGNVNTKYSNITNDNWAGVVINSSDLINGKPSKDDLRSDEPLGTIPEFHQHTAQEAYAKVLDYAGCSLHRDAIDDRLVTECRNGTATFKGASANKGGIIDSQTDLKPADAGDDWSPWPALAQTEAPADTDGDGMPDSWEKAHGLNPNDASDGKLTNNEGYTMLEVYLNSLVGEITEKQYDGAILMGTAGSTEPTTAPLTLSAWDFSNNVKYTQNSQNGTKTYYTASIETKENMEHTFASQQPFFYPTSGAVTNSTLTVLAVDGTKKWYISNYNNGALRMYTATPRQITNLTDASQHYNYAEVELSAEGYKNLKFSCRMSGNNSRTLPAYVLVSTDGGTTWKASSTLNNTGYSWSNFNETKAALAVDGKQNVKVRVLIGYDDKATGDMYLNSFKITGEAIGSDTPYSITTAVVPAAGGYVTMSPVGDAAVGGTEVSFAGQGMPGFKLKEWQDSNGNKVGTASSYTTTVSGNTTVKAVFGTVETYTLTVNKDGDGAKWGEVVLSPEPINGRYDAGTTVTLKVIPNNVTNFLTWENNSANLSRTITVNANTEVAATFDVIPFVVAWDFNNDKNTSRNNRPADYAFATDNTGMMQFYQGVAHTSTNWGSGKATFGGKEMWAARRYTDWSMSEQVPRAYVASFSVKGYDKIKIHSYVAANNSCVRQRQLMQVSTTSATEGFETIKTLTLTENPNSEWVSFDHELDTKAIDGMVYIRWIEDESSDFFDGGNHSGTEGFYLADVIIFADQNVSDDAEAPQLVSSSPASGSTAASARGNIVLSFNERVKAGFGSVTLNGETLEGSFGSKSVTYAYHGLQYGNTYTLSIGENAITDLSGNAFPACDITFTVMERPVPAAKVYDAVVAQDGSGDYNTVQEAIDNAPGNRFSPWLIFVKNGVYEELVTIPENKPFIHLIGQDKENTIIKYWINNGGSTDKGWEYSTNNPASKTYGKQAVVQVNSTDFYTENISYINSYGVEMQAGPMGLAMSSRNDRQAFNNCQFRSFQDTWYTDVRSSTARQYVNGCLIEGAVDFYYGAGNNYIENSTFRLAREGSVIVAPSHPTGTKWGYVMVNNIIDGKGGSNKLGRAWQNQPIAIWVNTTLMTTLAKEGWSEWHIAPKLFAEYNTMDNEGYAVDLNNRRTTYKVDEDKLAEGETSPVTRKAVLTAAEAAEYTYEAVTAGTDDWNPRKFFEPVDAPTDLRYEQGCNTLTWTASEYAICYVVIDADDNVVGFTKDNSFIADGISTSYTIRAVNEYGSLSRPTTIYITTGISHTTEGNENVSCHYYNINGIPLKTPVYGLNIVRRKSVDGQVSTKKILHCR